MGNSQIVPYTVEEHFDSDSVFSSENGFEFAIAFANLDNSGLIDPKYGEIILESWAWDSDGEGEEALIITEIETHICE